MPRVSGAGLTLGVRLSYLVPIAIGLGCASVPEPRVREGTDYGRERRGVWVRGPWESITPSADIDEVIDQLCPAVMQLPDARGHDDGVEYCGLIYTGEDGKIHASAPSRLKAKDLPKLFQSNVKTCSMPLRSTTRLACSTQRRRPVPPGTVEQYERQRFSGWLATQAPAPWGTVRALWAIIDHEIPGFPLPTAGTGEDGSAQLAWSLPDLYLEIEGDASSRLLWYVRDLGTGRSEAGEGDLFSIPPPLRDWLEALAR